MYFKFWGTRGSIPVPGKNTLKYGGNTPCVEIRTKSNKLIILDAGSGIRELGNKLISNKNNNNDINVFISHYHWDHIQGLPFFSPLYKENSNITFYGNSVKGSNISDHLKNQMTSKYFPFPLEKVNANIKYKDIFPSETFNLDGMQIQTFLANHPSPTLTFKIIEDHKSLIYLTDNEINFEPEQKISIENLKKYNKGLINFCEGADYLIHDAMYDEKSLYEKKGWGHSSNVLLAYFSIIAKIKNLILFHYNPDYSDDKIDQLLKETKNIFKEQNSSINCIAAKEGLEIEF